ncbi:MAG: hypothetical protein AAGF11_13285 [Myxococcota bacterium]
MSQTPDENADPIPEPARAAIQALARGTIFPRRAPILKTPAEYDLEHEDVFFQSLDGIPLEGWFIPAPSNKLVICNHPMTMNRYGFPGHLQP